MRLTGRKGGLVILGAKSERCRCRDGILSRNMGGKVAVSCSAPQEAAVVRFSKSCGSLGIYTALTESSLLSTQIIHPTPIPLAAHIITPVTQHPISSIAVSCHVALDLHQDPVLCPEELDRRPRPRHSC